MFKLSIPWRADSIFRSGQGVFQGEQHKSLGLHLLGVLNSVALALFVIGGVKLGNAKSEDDVHSALNYRHIGAVLFLVLYLFVALVHGYFWLRIGSLMKHRRRVSTINQAANCTADTHTRLAASRRHFHGLAIPICSHTLRCPSSLCSRRSSTQSPNPQLADKVHFYHRLMADLFGHVRRRRASHSCDISRCGRERIFGQGRDRTW